MVLGIYVDVLSIHAFLVSILLLAIFFLVILHVTVLLLFPEKAPCTRYPASMEYLSTLLDDSFELAIHRCPRLGLKHPFSEIGHVVERKEILGVVAECFAVVEHG
jgi:hypothetical protein